MSTNNIFGDAKFCVSDYNDQQSKPKNIGGKAGSLLDCLCNEISFLLKWSWAKKSRENTKDEVRRMTRERKKRKRQERRLHKENVLLSALQIKKNRFERQEKICD